MLWSLPPDQALLIWWPLFLNGDLWRPGIVPFNATCHILTKEELFQGLFVIQE